MSIITKKNKASIDISGSINDINRNRSSRKSAKSKNKNLFKSKKSTFLDTNSNMKESNFFISNTK